MAKSYTYSNDKQYKKELYRSIIKMWKRKRKKKIVDKKQSIEEVQALEAAKEKPSTEQHDNEIVEKTLSTENKQAAEMPEETLATKGQQANVIVEKALSVEEENTKKVSEEEPSAKEQEQISKAIEQIPCKEEESPHGVFIFGKKVEGNFKRILTALFSIFTLPPATFLGLLIVTGAVLIAFPFICFTLTIVLIALCMLSIAAPIILPIIILIAFIIERGKVHFGLKNKKIAINILGLTLPRHAD